MSHIVESHPSLQPTVWCWHLKMAPQPQVGTCVRAKAVQPTSEKVGSGKQIASVGCVESREIADYPNGSTPGN
jgi:hypothetical protein